MLASNYRGDLATGGDYQSHLHGFSFPTPFALLDGNSHTINVMFGGSSIPLFNSGNFFIGRPGGPVSGCPGQLSITTATWQFTPLYYSSRTSLSSSAVATAVNAWNGIQSNINMIYYSAGIGDIDIADDDTLDYLTVAVTTPLNGTNDPCYGYQDTCGRCVNTKYLYGMNITIHEELVRTTATGTGVPLLSVSTEVVSHELGHALTLDHVTAAVQYCSGIQSIMFDGFYDKLGCSVFIPTSTCDGPAVGRVYGVGPSSCVAFMCSATPCTIP